MPGKSHIALLFAAALSAAGPVAGQPTGGAGCPAPGAPVTEPYRWYPALDLSRIPFHAGAGPWGPRARILAPEPPVTTRNVRVTSAAEMAAEARIPGTQITVGAQFIGPVVMAYDVTDLDIVVPPGHRIAQLTVGRYAPASTTQRVRIRGTSPGTHSGGLVGSVFFGSATATDVILDGIDLNGDDGKGGNLMLQISRGAERVAIVNVRWNGVGPATIIRGNNVVIAGNRMMSGARSRESNGYPEGWGIRAIGRIVVYDNRIDGTRYHRVRIHPEAGPPLYAWVANNTFVDPHEARIFSAFNASGATSYRYAGVWAVCNRIYAHSTCMPPSFDGIHADYAMLTSNAFFGSFKQETQQMLQSQQGPGRDYVTGNTYSAWQAPPAWQSPGDPNASVPLPAEMPGRYNPSAAAGTKPCPPP